MNDRKIILGVIVIITLAPMTSLLQPLGKAEGLIDTSTGERSGGVGGTAPDRKAPPAITGDNVFTAWWTNETGNDEVMFRASTDAGKTFENKINLSNSTDANSTRVEIDSDADSVVVTWWETNQTDDTPVMRISTDNGKSFGPIMRLGNNGTLTGGG
jgi:hypothetical protein